MRLELEVGGRVRTVTVEASGSTMAVTLDGRPVEIDVARLGPGRYSLRVPGTGRQHDVTVTHTAVNGQADVVVSGTTVTVTRRVGPSRSRHGAGATGEGPQRVLAPMPGKVVRVLVQPGDDVVARQGVIVVEAMKMENELRAARPGVVREVLVVEGASVEAGTPLVVIG